MQTTFAEVLETIETFTVDEKETLIDILQHRLAQIGWARTRLFRASMADLSPRRRQLITRKTSSAEIPKQTAFTHRN